MPKYNKPRRTLKYSNEFKVNAVQLSFSTGVTIKTMQKDSTFTRLCCHDGAKNIENESLCLINVKKRQRFLAEEHQGDIDLLRNSELK